MSDGDFSRKYRPYTLDGYVGNTKVKENFKRAMASGHKPQSILLTGNTGCGKTTIARIISTWYMCENPHEDGSPCGECGNCLALKDYITTGNTEMLPDVHEVDASKNSGKSDMMSMIEEASYPAYGGGWKIYIIDECHALATGGSTALLKVVEEPPENVLFIFCTTDPQKMLETLKNRCRLKFEITKPNFPELATLLAKVCKANGKEYDMQGLRIICGRSNFVIRDSLNFLEQVLNSRGNAKGESVSEEFEEVSDSLIFEFYDAYINKDYLKYMGVMYKVKTKYRFDLFLRSLESFTIRGIYILNNVNVEGMSESELKEYADIFSKFDFGDIARILSSLKRMPEGNIEANLMSFIYQKDSVESRDEENCVSGVPQLVPQESESKFRNSNMASLEKAMLSKGRESLKDQMETSGFDGVSSMFTLKKINS